MPPKKTPYESPLLALLRGGKQTLVPPKPVQFGVPTVTPIIPTALPQTAQTTRQTVTPLPVQISEIQQKPNLQTLIPVNPLDIIRKGKEQVIRQGEPQKQTSAFLNPVRDALFGNPKDKAVLRDMQRRGIDPGFFSTWGTEGFMSLTGRGKEEQKERIYYDLIGKGIDPNRATEISYNAIESRDNNLSQIAKDLQSGEKSRRDQAADRLDELNLTTQEKVALGIQRAGQVVGTGLELLDFATAGSIKPVRKALSKEIGDRVAKIVANMTDEDATIIRRMYDSGLDKDMSKQMAGESAILKGTGIDKLPWQEQRQAVEEVLTAYDNRWSGVDEMFNPPAPKQRPGAMDIKRVETPTAPKTQQDMTQAIQKAKASGQSFDEIKNTLKGLQNNKEGGIVVDDTKSVFDSQGRGYSGNKSVNAKIAEGSGEYTAKQLENILGIKSSVIEKILTKSSAHHVGKSFNLTNYYDVNNVSDTALDLMFKLNNGKGRVLGKEISVMSPIKRNQFFADYFEFKKAVDRAKSQIKDFGDDAREFQNRSIGLEIERFVKKQGEDTRSQLKAEWDKTPTKSPLESVTQPKTKTPAEAKASGISFDEWVEVNKLFDLQDDINVLRQKRHALHSRLNTETLESQIDELSDMVTEINKKTGIGEQEAMKVKSVAEHAEKTLMEDDYFDFDEATLTTAGKEKLEDFINKMNDAVEKYMQKFEEETLIKNIAPTGIARNREFGGAANYENKDGRYDSVDEWLSQLKAEWDAATPPPVKKKLQAFREGKPNSQGGYIRNPLAETPASKVVNNQDVSLPKSIPRSTKRITPIDKLIAENKVRVISRDGRDVYQVKKGGEWRSVRDEDSAIKQATPKSPIDTITRKRELPNELEEKLMAVDMAKEALNENPAKELSRYVAKRGNSKGRLAEVTGKQGSKTGFGVDVRAEDLGFKSSEEARDAYDAYRLRKDEILAQERIVKEEIKQYRATVKIKEKTVIPEQAVDRVREIEKLAPEQVRSLEEVAQQIDEVLDLPPKMRAEPLTKIVTQTPVTKKVNLLDYIRTPDRVLNKVGFGKEAKMLRAQYEKYVIELPKNIETISEWVKRVPKESNERIFDFLDGVDVKLTPKEQVVADEIKQYLKTWADRLKLPEDNRVTNYITRLFEDSLIQKEFDEDLAKIISNKIPGQVYDPFLEKRLGAKGYKRDVWDALDAYTKRATRKVHLDPVLEKIRDKAGSSLEFTNLEESQFKYIQTYIDRVQMRPTYIDNLIDNGVKSLVGYRFGQRPVAYISQLLRRMTYRGMLGANLGSALRNISQGINTYATLGEKYTVIGYAKLFNTNAHKELAEQGVLFGNFIEDRTLSSTKQALQKADKALWFFFDQAEKINRGSAYFGAKAKGLGKGMSEAEAIEYAKSIVRKTQFAYDSVDAPVAMAGDLIKTLTQFQTFTVKQTEFLAEMLKDKNFLGLMRYAIGGYVFVNTVGQAMGMEEKELLPYLRFDVPPSMKFPVEVGKAALNVPDKYGNIPDTEKKLSNIGKSFLGLVPGGSQMKKTYEGIKSIKEGGSFDKAGRLQFEQTNTSAGKVQSALFGKYTSPQAKEYFNKVTNTGDPELDKFIEESKKKDTERNKQAVKLNAELKKLPPDEANARLKEIAATDAPLAKKIASIVKEEKKKATWTKTDEAISKLGVENGKRAEYVHNKAKQMTPDKANAYVKELYNKGVISKTVVEQLRELKAQDNVIID